MSKAIKYYDPPEERLNIWSHGIAALLSVIATILMLIKVGFSSYDWITVLVYGGSMILLYTASTLYHSAKEEAYRKKMKVFDHASIYLLIAGTYTPFCLLVLRGDIGWTIFSISWGIAIVGIIFKLFFTGRFKLFSTLLYVAMGWLIIFVIKPLMNNLSEEGLFWLFAGGAAYTIGAVLYSIKKIPFNHAIFHFFVVAGSACHFIALYFYVL